MAKNFSGKIDKTYTISGRIGIPVELRITPQRDAFSSIENRLDAAIATANKTISERLVEALDSAMRSQVWATNNGNADIIDLGVLSASLNIATSGNQVIVSYDKPYANLVHYGGYILPYGNSSLEKVYVPPRPWVQSVLQGGGPIPKFDFESIYRQAIAQVFR